MLFAYGSDDRCKLFPSNVDGLMLIYLLLFPTTLYFLKLIWVHTTLIIIIFFSCPVYSLSSIGPSFHFWTGIYPSLSHCYHRQLFWWCGVRKHWRKGSKKSVEIFNEDNSVITWRVGWWRVLIHPEGSDDECRMCIAGSSLKLWLSSVSEMFFILFFYLTFLL